VGTKIGDIMQKFYYSRI